MRIIAGSLKGRRIVVPDGAGTRPLLARVRKALFSTLGNLVPDAVVLDLFAGTGSLGLEAVSRGAARVRAVERDRDAVAWLRQSVENFQLAAQVEISRGDALNPRTWRSPSGEPGPWADLIFLDPPYPDLREQRQRTGLFRAVATLYSETLRESGALVLHTHLRAAQAVDFPSGIDLERRAYGSTALWYLWKGRSKGHAPATTEAETERPEALEE